MIFDRGDACVEDDPCGDERGAWESARIPVGMPR